MKRVLSLVLTLALLLGLAACGEKVPTWQEQYDLGIRYLEESSYEEAIIAFTAAIEIDPKQAAAYLGLADAYIAISNIDAAEQALHDGVDATGEENLQTRLEELEVEQNTDRTDMARENRYYGDDNSRPEVVFEYDENGKLIREAHYFPDGNLEDVYEYDENEKRIRLNHYIPDNILVSVSDYDTAGNIIRKKTAILPRRREHIGFINMMRRVITFGRSSIFLTMCWHIPAIMMQTEMFSTSTIMSPAKSATVR